MFYLCSTGGSFPPLMLLNALTHLFFMLPVDDDVEESLRSREKSPPDQVKVKLNKVKVKLNSS